MRQVTILLALVISVTAYAGHHEEKNNIAIIDKFFAIDILDTKNDIQTNGNAKSKPKLILGLFM